MNAIAGTNTKELTGIILAGGLNSRMGTNKAFLQVVDGQPIIDSIVELFSSLFKETIVVSNQVEIYKYLGVKVVPDIILKKNPLCGIHAGLMAAETNNSFIVPCDMPFLQPDLIKLLVSEVNEDKYDVVVPQIDSYLQPLHAIYSKKCIKPIEKCLVEDIKKVIALYPWVKVNYVGETKMNKVCTKEELDKVFLNVNTKEELEKAREM
ncbi:MAG: molybdenum cofactor guanylyltransferase [Bacillota bacterium]|nr:molybdenum cofactor guanylyltransferase [Bacillota bacterium]